MDCNLCWTPAVQTQQKASAESPLFPLALLEIVLLIVNSWQSGVMLWLCSKTLQSVRDLPYSIKWLTLFHKCLVCSWCGYFTDLTWQLSGFFESLIRWSGDLVIWWSLILFFPGNRSTRDKSYSRHDWLVKEWACILLPLIDYDLRQFFPWRCLWALFWVQRVELWIFLNISWCSKVTVQSVDCHEF